MDALPGWNLPFRDMGYHVEPSQIGARVGSCRTWIA